MFDLVTGQEQHLPRHATLPMMLSITAQAVAVTALILVPALFFAERIPELPTMMVFVASPPPPPAPPPPAPPIERAAARPLTKAATPVTREFVAPVEAPSEVAPEPAAADDWDEGVPGGVEGGVPGGIVGGVVGGLPEPLPPPPAAAPPPPKAPVRIGGKISPPELVHRVEPVYPGVAVAARIQGVAILETIVDEEGRVTDVRILRSAHTLLDGAALTAVRQWRYKPVVLNGVPVKFVLTVTLSFRLEEKKG